VAFVSHGNEAADGVAQVDGRGERFTQLHALRGASTNIPRPLHLVRGFLVRLSGGQRQ
jgi:hypothetical protein